MTDQDKQTKGVVDSMFHVKQNPFVSYPIHGGLSEIMAWLAKHPRKNRQVNYDLTKWLVGNERQG